MANQPNVPPPGEWQNKSLRVLEPGMDFIDGILYLTIPQFRMVHQKVGQGANARIEPTIEKGAAVISTDRQFFMYDKSNLYERGFSFPDTFTVNEQGWGAEAAQAWTDGKAEVPEAWDLYQRIRNVYTTYVEFAEEMLHDFMSMYIIATYFYKVFDSFGYVHFGGTKESGKSQNLRIVNVLAFNSTMSVNMTAPDLFRNIAGNPGTVCIDEAENFRGERGDSLKDILKSGYTKGGTVSRQRQTPSGHFVPDKFNIYGPKVLASITPLDNVTATRAFKVAMRPALRPIPEFKASKAPWATLRNDLYYFALANAEHVANTYERWSQPEYRAERASRIINRNWEVAAPIIVMADFIGGDDLVDPLIEWLADYFEAERKRDDSTDFIRTMVISLPTLLRDTNAAPGWYYPLQNVLTVFKQFTDEDATDKVTTRTVAKWLTPIGLTDIQAVRGGKQVQISEERLREIFTERRIEPRDEDRAWLAGETDYQLEHRLEQPKEAETMTIEFGKTMEEQE